MMGGWINRAKNTLLVARAENEVIISLLIHSTGKANLAAVTEFENVYLSLFSLFNGELLRSGKQNG